MGIRFHGYSVIMDFLGVITVVETYDVLENVIIKPEHKTKPHFTSSGKAFSNLSLAPNLIEREC